MNVSLTRRQLLAASAALAAPFVPPRSAALAASLPSVPVIDRLTVAVITDSTTGNSHREVRDPNGSELLTLLAGMRGDPWHHQV